MSESVSQSVSVRCSGCDALKGVEMILKVFVCLYTFQSTYSQNPLPNLDGSWTALHWAAAFGKEDCIKALVSHGADIHARANVGRVGQCESVCEVIHLFGISLFLELSF